MRNFLVALFFAAIFGFPALGADRPNIVFMIADDATPAGLDGVSFAPTLMGKPQEPRKLLYRESPGNGGQQCVRVGDWKAIRQNVNRDPRANIAQPGPVELYNLAVDPSETSDVDAQHPDVVAKLSAIMKEQHVKSELWPIPALDAEPAAGKP
jgi:arylsulfatase A